MAVVTRRTRMALLAAAAVLTSLTLLYQGNHACIVNAAPERATAPTEEVPPWQQLQVAESSSTDTTAQANRTSTHVKGRQMLENQITGFVPHPVCRAGPLGFLIK